MLKIIGWFQDRFQFRFYAFIYSIRYGVVSNFMNACWAMRLAWKFLTGKIQVIDAKKETSNGGFKYHAVILSAKPVSYTYDEKLF